MAAAPIRPPVWPLAPTSVAPAKFELGRADARLTAQKAFFEAALAGKAEAATAADPQPAPRAAPAQAAKAAAAADARVQDRLPPPGSVLNIVV